MNSAIRARVIRNHLRDLAGRRALIEAMISPTRSLLEDRPHDPVSRALQAAELLSTLDRLDEAMAPDEPREASWPPGRAAIEPDPPEIGGQPLTFGHWRDVLRRIVDDAVREDPEVRNVITAAEVMDA